MFAEVYCKIEECITVLIIICNNKKGDFGLTTNESLGKITYLKTNLCYGNI